MHFVNFCEASAVGWKLLYPLILYNNTLSKLKLRPQSQWILILTQLWTQHLKKSGGLLPQSLLRFYKNFVILMWSKIYGLRMEGIKICLRILVLTGLLLLVLNILQVSKIICIYISHRLWGTDLPAYSDTTYSESLLTVTVFGLNFGSHNSKNCWLEWHLLIVSGFCWSHHGHYNRYALY